MPEFIAKDPNTEVLGFVVQSYITALGKEIAPIAARFGLDHFDPLGGWVNLQMWLDLLKEAAQGDMKAVFDMVKVGMRAHAIGQSMLERLPTIEQWFLSLQENNRLAYRGGEIGELYATLVRPGHFEVHSFDPHPCDMQYGAFYAATRLMRPQEMAFVVTHRQGSCRHVGDEYCIYDIKWWKEEDEDEGVAGRP